MAFDPKELPQSAEDLHAYAKTTDVEQAMDAALAWSLLYDDFSACDIPAVAAYVSAGMHVTDGAGECRAQLIKTRDQGRFSITSPGTQATVWITLAITPPSSDAP